MPDVLNTAARLPRAAGVPASGARRSLDVAALLLALSGPVLLLVPASPATAVLGLVWSLFVPGWALICWPTGLPAGERAFMAVCLSVTLMVLTGLLMSETRWAPHAALVIETLLAAAACLMGALRGLWRTTLPARLAADGRPPPAAPAGPADDIVDPEHRTLAADGGSGARSRGSRRGVVLPWALLGGAVVCLAALAASGDAVSRTPDTGLGLAPHLPVTAWVATTAAALVCAGTLGLRRHRAAFAGGATVLLALSTVGIPSIVYDAARLPTTWVHVGFVEAVARGAIPHGIDARFSWPGLFLQWAWRIDAAPDLSIDAVARWFPPVVVLLWCWGVQLLARRLDLSAGAALAAVWLFLLGNWVEQDYFSPQALAFLLTLGVLVLVAGALRRIRPPARHPEHPPSDPLPPPETSPGAAAFALVAVLGLSYGAAVSHQLTPLLLILQLCILVVFRRLARPELVLAVAFIVIAWFVLGADEFWRNQLHLATGQVGRAANVSDAVTGRLTGSPEQMAVKWARLGLSAVVVGLALVAAIRRRTDRWLLLTLAFCPVVLVVLQGYGGEIGLRVYFFALPFLAILVGPMLAEAARRRPVLGAVAVGLALTVGAVGLVVLRGGNDAYSFVSARQVALVREFLHSAPPREPVYWPTPDGPVRAAGITTNSYPTDGCGGSPDIEGCINRLQPYGIVITQSMDNSGVLLDGRQPGWTRRLAAEYITSRRYRVWVDRAETLILVRNPT